jgi:hypothetical protein
MDSQARTAQIPSFSRMWSEPVHRCHYNKRPFAHLNKNPSIRWFTTHAETQKTNQFQNFLPRKLNINQHPSNYQKTSIQLEPGIWTMNNQIIWPYNSKGGPIWKIDEAMTYLKKFQVQIFCHNVKGSWCWHAPRNSKYTNIIQKLPRRKHQIHKHYTKTSTEKA